MSKAVQYILENDKGGKVNDDVAIKALKINELEILEDILTGKEPLNKITERVEELKEMLKKINGYIKI